jgi:D-alanyl-D-alanine carboxypeptidase
MLGTCAKRLGAFLALAFMSGLGSMPDARAQIGSERYAAIVTDARTGNALVAASPDERRYPASLTKMMTIYMAFEALRDGRTTLNSPVDISRHAATMPPSKLGLAPGMTVTVEEAILALVTKSANDAAAALGEHLSGGSEARFAQMMTLKARALGMTRTTFRNASGLPDPEQVSTARDMALLGRRLMQDYPAQYSYFSTPHFVFRGRTHWNHNRLLQEYEGTDGIKTGYINDSGFNLVASANRDGVRLIAAVFGGRTGRERDRHMMALLDQGFGQMGIAPVARRSLPPVMATASAATARGAPVLRRVTTTRQVQTRPTAQTRSTARTPTRTQARNAARTPPRATTRTQVRKPALVRTTARTTRPRAAQVEQGDTSGPVARAARRPAAKPVAKRPAKAVARNRQR